MVHIWSSGSIWVMANVLDPLPHGRSKYDPIDVTILDLFWHINGSHVISLFSSPCYGLLLNTVEYSSSDKTKFDINNPDSSLLTFVKPMTPILSGFIHQKDPTTSNGEDGSSYRSKAHGHFLHRNSSWPYLRSLWELLLSTNDWYLPAMLNSTTKGHSDAKKNFFVEWPLVLGLTPL